MYRCSVLTVESFLHISFTSYWSQNKLNKSFLVYFCHYNTNRNVLVVDYMDHRLQTIFGKHVICPNGCLLTPDDLCGDHWASAWLVLPYLQLPVHLAPDARVTPIDLAAVVAARALQVEEDTEGEGINPTVGEMSDAQRKYLPRLLHYVHQLVTNFVCLLLSAGGGGVYIA